MISITLSKSALEIPKTCETISLISITLSNSVLEIQDSQNHVIDINNPPKKFLEIKTPETMSLISITLPKWCQKCSHRHSSSL